MTARGDVRHNVVKLPLLLVGQCSVLEGAHGGPWHVQIGCVDYWWLLGAWAQLYFAARGAAVKQWLGNRDFVTALHGATDAELQDLRQTQLAYQDQLLGESGTMPDLTEYAAYMDGVELRLHHWPSPELGRWYELGVTMLPHASEQQNSWLRRQDHTTFCLGDPQPCVLTQLTRLPDSDPTPLQFSQSLLNALHTPIGEV